MEGDEERDLNQRKEPDKMVPDLALTMQAMSLSEPGLCRIQEYQEKKQEVLDFSCCLIMKVACTGATPRSLSQQAIEEAMTRAWKDKFHGITQVSNSVFMAHFKSQEDMVSVYIKQPWVASSENLLVDWFDPNLHATSPSDYKFDSILVTVRAYGIPRNKRSINLLKNILNQVGEVSDFHVLQETNLFAKQDYIWGTAKLIVTKPLKDKIAVSFADSSSVVAYLHYEKRACLFCGTMFHNVQDCAVRNNMISERQKRRQSSADIPVYRFGQWIINERFIPEELIHKARMGDQSSSQEGSVILQRLRNLFAQDPNDKGKAVDDPPNLQEQVGEQYNTNNSTMSLHGRIATIQENNGRLLIMGNAGGHFEGQNNNGHGKVEVNKGTQGYTRAESNANPQITAHAANIGNASRASVCGNTQLSSQGLQQHQYGKEKVVSEIPTRVNNSKRSAPSSEAINQPKAKKMMAGTQNIVQGDGILGAAPSQTCFDASKAVNIYDPKAKCKQSRWDVPNVFMPGTNIWKRNTEAANERKHVTIRKTKKIPASPCRSDANSVTAGSYEHDPWPLHTPGASGSQGTQDSRLGAFSPPQMTRELYEAPITYPKAPHQQNQASQQIQSNNEEQDNEAAAPAFKAPQAP